MTAQLPPPNSTTFLMKPHLETLAAGTELWRCHQTRFPGAQFSPVTADLHFGGSRFDGTALDPYPYLYAAAEQTTALAEVLLRSMPFDTATGTRLIPHARVAGRSLTALRTTVDLVLIRLVSEEDLAAVCQDSWLLETEGIGYAQTRRWAGELRARVPQAQGLLWQSRRHRPRPALVLFGDRCGVEPVKTDPGNSFRLDTPEGTAQANRLLAPLRAALVPLPAVEATAAVAAATS
ncbi:RES family NAD+ phosphorylase [Kitasatospora kifunensis]|uniref:RES domain-containing protein n=1 Tax=Kitasatospora kifunensis TaxID=58351 RepID=A0A7W7R915_KITKI|nr:RES family NAD+ phosphorylase [Kitasatospora kifunensis]MBB4927564.1 hypothetical protein [Kitasatospora kifunensis]